MVSAVADTDRLFRLGCAVWACKDWTGEFFPPGSRASDYLKLYGERLTTVEGNTTFYSLPSPDMVKRWANETPEHFRFCPKIPRTISHEGALTPHLAKALDFLRLMQGLGIRLGPLLLQLPPSYSPASYEDLAAFLTAWPRAEAQIALEVRHLDWFKPADANRLNGLLTALGVGRILLDTRPIYELDSNEGDPQLRSERPKPRVPLQPEVTAAFSIVRYISHPECDRNNEYLAQWFEHFRHWLTQGTSIYMFVHCPIEAHSVTIAHRFQAMLEKAAVEVPALPWNLLERPPEQLALF
jgi:uncharacterized protein YecE (DUF72 family)